MHDSITLEGHAVGIVTKEQVFDESFDSICGLAYPQMAPGSRKLSPPLFDNMMAQQLLNQKRFAFYMSLCQEEQKSEITFGWDDPSRYI